MTVNWPKLIEVTEVTVLTSLSSFVASISQMAGPAFDGRHLAAAGIGALTAFGYKMAGVLQTFTATAPAPVEKKTP